jgi:hypothetical protein
MCRYIIGICSSSLNLVMVHWFLTELSLLNFEKKNNRNFQFPLSNFCLDACIGLKFYVYIHHRNAQVKFIFGYGRLILTKLSLLKLQKDMKFSVSILELLLGWNCWSNDFWPLSSLKLEKIKHGFKTLAESGSICGIDDTSSSYYLKFPLKCQICYRHLPLCF